MNLRDLRAVAVLAGAAESCGGWRGARSSLVAALKLELASGLYDTSNIIDAFQEVSGPPRRRGGPNNHSLRLRKLDENALEIKAARA